MIYIENLDIYADIDEHMKLHYYKTTDKNIELKRVDIPTMPTGCFYLNAITSYNKYLVGPVQEKLKLEYHFECKAVDDILCPYQMVVSSNDHLYADLITEDIKLIFGNELLDFNQSVFTSDNYSTNENFWLAWTKLNKFKNISNNLILNETTKNDYVDYYLEYEPSKMFCLNNYAHHLFVKMEDIWEVTHLILHTTYYVVYHGDNTLVICDTFGKVLNKINAFEIIYINNYFVGFKGRNGFAILSIKNNTYDIKDLGISNDYKVVLNGYERLLLIKDFNPADPIKGKDYYYISPDNSFINSGCFHPYLIENELSGKGEFYMQENNGFTYHRSNLISTFDANGVLVNTISTEKHWHYLWLYNNMNEEPFVGLIYVEKTEKDEEKEHILIKPQRRKFTYQPLNPEVLDIKQNYVKALNFAWKSYDNEELNNELYALFIQVQFQDGERLLFHKSDLIECPYRYIRPIVGRNSRAFTLSFYLQVGDYDKNSNIKWGVINHKGKLIVPIQYDNIVYGFARIVADKDLYKINETKEGVLVSPKEGKPISALGCYFAYKINNGILIVNKDGSTYDLDTFKQTKNPNCYEIDVQEGTDYYDTYQYNDWSVIIYFNKKNRQFFHYRHNNWGEAKSNNNDDDYNNYDDMEDSRSYYNDNVDMDQQSQDFWDNLEWK